MSDSAPFDPFADALLERHEPDARYAWSVSMAMRTVLLTNDADEAADLASTLAVAQGRRLWLREPGVQVVESGNP